MHMNEFYSLFLSDGSVGAMGMTTASSTVLYFWSSCSCWCHLVVGDLPYCVWLMQMLIVCGPGIAISVPMKLFVQNVLKESKNVMTAGVSLTKTSVPLKVADR